VNLIPKFYARQRMIQFPQGFYFGHIIADECQVLRNPMTGWSRLVRMLIKSAYASRTPAQIDQAPASLVLVSATPALNVQADYRGLCSLF